MSIAMAHLKVAWLETKCLPTYTSQ